MSARSSSRSASVSQSMVGVLAPTPRGSNPMRSKRSVIGLPDSPDAMAATKPVPDPPGPPGLSSREPIGSPVARWRSTAIDAVPPAGSA
jgi:hypothetical protein